MLLKGRAYHLQRLIKTLLSKEGFESFESGVSIAHLENRVAGSLQLGARDEFRIYLYMYAKRLGAECLQEQSRGALKEYFQWRTARGKMSQKLTRAKAG